MKIKYFIAVTLVLIVGLAIFNKLGKEVEPSFSNQMPLKEVSENDDVLLSKKQNNDTGTKLSLQENKVNQVLKKVSALSVDKLLDESDRTVKNRLIIQNHSNLVEIFKDLKILRKDKNNVVTKERLTKWIQSLINDAYLNNELGHNNVPQIEFTDMQTLRLDLIPAENNVSRLINPDYLKALRTLAEQLSNIDTQTNSENTLRSLAARTIDLAKRRKEQSEVFYLTLMHKYFPSQDYTMPQKISFAEQFIEAGDFKLAKYSMEFFQDSLNLPENKNDKISIQLLIKRIEDGLNEK